LHDLASVGVTWRTERMWIRQRLTGGARVDDRRSAGA